MMSGRNNRAGDDAPAGRWRPTTAAKVGCWAAVWLPIFVSAGARAESVFLGKTISARFEVEIYLYKGATLVRHGLVPFETSVLVDGKGTIYNIEGGKRGEGVPAGRMSNNHLWTLSGHTLSSLSVSATGNNTVSFSSEGDQCSVEAHVTNKQGYVVKSQTRTAYCRLESAQNQ